MTFVSLLDNVMNCLLCTSVVGKDNVLWGGLLGLAVPLLQNVKIPTKTSSFPCDGS